MEIALISAAFDLPRAEGDEMGALGFSKILVVDDDEWIREGARAVLEERDFQVLLAQDGAQGLALALQEQPRIVVVDVLMPEMDGFTFVRHLRTNPQFALTPVVFMTALREAKDRITGFQLGADEYLQKPFNLAELPRRIMTALAARRELETRFRSFSRSEPCCPALSGTFDRVGLASVLGILSQGGRTGLLRLSAPGALEALLFLVGGRIHRAEIQGEGQVRDPAKLGRIFGWLSGAFEFYPTPLSVADELKVSTVALLLREAREEACPADPGPGPGRDRSLANTPTRVGRF